MRKLTIGMAVYDDFDGVYFTIQSLRLFHPEVMKDVEFIIINNNPKSAHGEAIYKFKNWITEPSSIQYVEFDSYSSTSIRNKVFDLADTPYVLCIDCHVMIPAGTIKRLIQFYDYGLDDGNLLHGPMLYDGLDDVCTHMEPTWGSHMWGQWGTDERGIDVDSKPFEIPMHGMGLFSCRRDSWLGFSDKFRGFGGEEGYIHEKYRNAGKRVICLPFLRWLHRFPRPGGVPYTLNIKDRFRNYMVGFSEVGLNIDDIIENFKGYVTSDYIEEVKQELNLNIT